VTPPRRSFDLSSWWFQGAILTYLFGFTVLGIIAYLVYSEQPPMPARVVSADGRTLFTGEDIRTGMNVFQRTGLMEYGSVYGHGAYLGPDYTADYLHRSAERMIAAYRKAHPKEWSAEEQVRRELHRDTYDPATGILSWTSERAAAHGELLEHYTKTFANPATHAGMGQRWIPDPEADFFNLFPGHHNISTRAQQPEIFPRAFQDNGPHLSLDHINMHIFHRTQLGTVF
jgi:nitric oxide reductase subunit B